MKKNNIFVTVVILMFIMTGCTSGDILGNGITNSNENNINQSEIPNTQQTNTDGNYVLKADVKNINHHLDFTNSDLKTIYFAGGCFWGVEAFMQQIYGVENVDSGYANGTIDDPSYREVIKGDTGFVEAVEVTFDPERIDLETLVDDLFLVIDPTSKNKQGNDVGEQYRPGIYSEKDDDLETIQTTVDEQQKQYDEEIVTEVEPLKNFYIAEEEHQDYLEKNPNGYCHIDLSITNKLAIQPIEKDEAIVQEYSE